MGQARPFILAYGPRRFSAGTEGYVKATETRALREPCLVNSFVAAMAAAGWQINRMPAWLGKEVGMTIHYPRMREWATGARATPHEVATAMARVALPWVLERAGLKQLPESILIKIALRLIPWSNAISRVPQRVAATRSLPDEEWLVSALLPAVRMTPAIRGTNAGGKLTRKHSRRRS